MKIALAQHNYHIGNFRSNTKKIIESIERSIGKADIVVFSELSVCGYPPLDLLEQKDFVLQCENSVKEIAQACAGIVAIVGSPTINEEPNGKKLYNSALVLSEGAIIQKVNKTLLPTYDIFDEYRYFESNTNFELLNIKGRKIALTICEDLWDKQEVETTFGKDKLYRISPMEELKKLNPEFIINIAASPFSYNQEYLRTNVLKDNVYRYNLPIVYVNQIGANTEIVFDGASKVLNAKGKIVHELKEFAEDYAIIDIDKKNNEEGADKGKYEKMPKIYDALVLGIRDYFSKTGFKSAILGLSGGIDSAVTAVLAADALGAENVYGILMPSKYSSDHSVKDAEDLANNLGMHQNLLSIELLANAFDTTLKPLFDGTPFGIAEENLQARIRGTLLMAVSNKFGHVLLNTSNKSEAAVGYGTLYGDMNGGLAVLGDVYKTDVFDLAWWLNRDYERIPENSIVKPPSAELRPDQKDSDSLPDYSLLDKILFCYIERKMSLSSIIAEGFSEEVVKKVLSMVNRNEFKRFQTPPILRVSSKAFGLGRRIPIVSQY